MTKFWVVLKEAYRKNIQSIGFIVMVLTPLILLGIGLGIGYYVSNAEDEALPIAVVTENQQVKELLASERLELDIDPNIQSEAQAEAALGDETIEGYVVVQVENETINATYTAKDPVATSTSDVLYAALTSYQTELRGQSLNLSPEEVESLTSPIEFTETAVEVEEGIVEEEEEADFVGDLVRQGAAYAINIGIFFFVITYASIIAQEIASEKGTRIMEVILSSVSSSVHFFGKLTGILLVCLTQIALYALIAILAYTQLKKTALVQSIVSVIDFSQLDASFIGISLILFTLGIVLYVVLAAFFGSLVTKMEDVNKAVAPVTYLALAGFYGGIFAFANVEHVAVEVLSYIPILTPFVMPFRIAAETVSTTGIWLSVLTTFLFTVLTTWISLIMYRSNVLVYSDTGLWNTIKRSWGIQKSERSASTVD